MDTHDRDEQEVMKRKNLYVAVGTGIREYMENAVKRDFRICIMISPYGIARYSEAFPAVSKRILHP